MTNRNLSSLFSGGSNFAARLLLLAYHERDVGGKNSWKIPGFGIKKISFKEFRFYEFENVQFKLENSIKN